MAKAVQTESEYKFGAGRYWQMANAISLLGTEAQRLGKKVYIIGGKTALAHTAQKVMHSLQQAGLAWRLEEYSGPPSPNQIALHCDRVRQEQCDVMIGIGGGRVLDLSKAIAACMDLPVITVPTSAATCAAFAPLSILYEDDGTYCRCIWHPSEVNAVLVDTDIQAVQPPRLLASGILDAMAKAIEITHGKSELKLHDVPLSLHSAYALAKYTYQVLENHGLQAVKDIAAGQHSKIVDDIIFLNIALTGVISGMTKGKGQTAIGHAFYNAIRTGFVREAAGYLHGEIVAVGLLAQLVYNGCSDQVPKLRDYMHRLKVPCSLSELGIAPDRSNLEMLFRHMKARRFASQNQQQDTQLYNALKSICGGQL